MQGPGEIESSSQAWPGEREPAQAGRIETGRAEGITTGASRERAAGRAEGSTFREIRG